MHYTKTAENAICNMLNGNNREAKLIAKRISYANLVSALSEMGYTMNEAVLRADYLKNRVSWNEYCQKETK